MTQKKRITEEKWEQLLNEQVVSDKDLNSLVMNYLVTEGFKEAAEEFQKETGTLPEVDLEELSSRREIRQSINEGNIQKSVELINELDPELFDNNPNLYFHLQKQKLIELIKSGNQQIALEFAQELGQLCEGNEELLNELDEVMALFTFDKLDNSPLSFLVDNSQRQSVSREVNSSILSTQKQEDESKIEQILKTLFYCQEELDKKIQFPKLTKENLPTGKLVFSEEKK
ncbi:glucose-induced degradation protein [Anaeramoeba flamelloides]|uniref:Glucose-induced degradation protein n=1 Tax=Anaeramoeba flamelloides TaxID=1746091 RepID=A0AAV8A8Y4_9EUKA|nr:glucose-induced degradation protein 8 [Anaeramoeba flamelloides]KAJ6250685.1 glucose-induced degradation protein [Anaeramoeba flamelloides]